MMFKKIKRYLALQKIIQIEILETLCTICLYLSHERDGKHNPYSRYFPSHFGTLKDLSEKLRDMESNNDRGKKPLKTLRKKHRFIKWLKKVLKIQSPSLREWKDIDEIHTVKDDAFYQSLMDFATKKEADNEPRETD